MFHVQQALGATFSILDPIIFVSATLKLVYAFAAIALLWWTIRLINWSTGTDVRAAIKIITSNPVALAIYRGGVFFSTAYIIAHAIGVLLLAVLVGSLVAPPAQAGTFPAQYDRAIKSATATWMPGVPWIIYKAQLYQESRLDPAAVSPVGAAGIAQFMPATWAAIAPALKYDIADRRVAAPAIEAGAYYMAQLRRGWSTLADIERHNFAMASYNAGPGNIRKAWGLCGHKPDWTPTSTCLPRVTGRHAEETITYVARIWRWYFAML